MSRLLFCLVILASVVAVSSADTASEKVFERMKKLEGTWESKPVKGSDHTSKVIYRLTGGGSALMETLDPGGAYEMLSVYHMNKGKLMMTHYCAAHNQPRMRMLPIKSPNVVEFDFIDGTNMKASDMHIHHVKFTFVDADHIISDWVGYNKGKPAGTEHFDIYRSKVAEK